MSVSDDPNSSADDPLERANARLEAACARVADRFDRLAGQLSQAVAGETAGDDDEARALAGALQAARAREAELMAAAEEASSALSLAISQLDDWAASDETS